MTAIEEHLDPVIGKRPHSECSFVEKSVSVDSDFKDGDEALRHIGAERTAQFSEEYNLKLRKKIDRLIPPLCAAVFFTQYLDDTSLNYASILDLPITGQNGNIQIFGGFVAYVRRLSLAKNPFDATVSYQGVSSFSARKHIAPWRIIYAGLGVLTILVGVGVFIWLPDSPAHAKFLTKEERIAALHRVHAGIGSITNKRWKTYQVKEAVTDLRTWLFVLTVFLTGIPNGALSNCETLPPFFSFRVIDNCYGLMGDPSVNNIIIKNFGYTSKHTLILSVPSGVAAVVMALWFKSCSEITGCRTPMLPIAIPLLVPPIIGSAMLIGLNHSGQKMTLVSATYLLGTIKSAMASLYDYNASNTSGHTKKSIINAMTLVSFGVGNIVGTEIFQPKDAPDYIAGKTAIVVLLTIQLLVCLLIRWVNIGMNKKKLEIIAEETARRGWTEADVQRERDKCAFDDFTDKENIFFVYTT
ncbi:hypothetical protein CVT24_007788 [Panaeolus cyanescens]|uniref:MFS general substrate transporter n=1 Tax=Panaeolus cyanescens TaxID=181874 RepID=A0A409WYZ5_9AGAR|nr:hypothetical protein CVT24_007788 [Panaeolus cyanescens]